MEILLFLETIDPWIYLTIGTVLIIIDILLINTEVLIWIGVSIFGVACLRFFDFPGLVLLSSFPIFLTLLLLTSRTLLKKTYQNVKNDKSIVGVIEGAEGVVTKVGNSFEEPCLAQIEGHGEWKILFEFEIAVEPKVGMRILVEKMQGLHLIVNPK
jgi:membrane protein implicated in regulation of membrane protease activity